MSLVITSIALYLSLSINAQTCAMHPHDYYTHVEYQLTLEQAQRGCPSPAHSSQQHTQPAPLPCDVERPFPRHTMPLYYRMRFISEQPFGWRTLPPIQDQPHITLNPLHPADTQLPSTDNTQPLPIHPLVSAVVAKPKRKPKYFTFEPLHIRLSMKNRLNFNQGNQS